MVSAALRIVRAVGVDLDVRTAEAGWECYERRGVALPEETISAIEAADATLLGVITTPSKGIS